MKASLSLPYNPCLIAANASRMHRWHWVKPAEDNEQAELGWVLVVLEGCRQCMPERRSLPAGNRDMSMWVHANEDGWPASWQLKSVSVDACMGEATILAIAILLSGLSHPPRQHNISGSLHETALLLSSLSLPAGQWYETCLVLAVCTQSGKYFSGSPC